MIKIGLDALGGDFGIKSTVPGAILAVQEMKDIEIVLYGDEDQIKPLIAGVPRISIVDTKTCISMGEKDPVKAIRTQKDSSLVKVMKAAKEHEVDAVVTSGPTQCVVVGAHLVIRKLEFMSRIALCPIISNLDRKGRLILDVGANVELRPEHVSELATFASIVAKIVLNVDEPKVGLLNIGSEPGKGREIDKEYFQALANNPHINFYGNVEPTEVLDSPVEIIITDGFSGNICIKTVEGTAKIIGKMLKQEIKSSIGGKIGYLFMRKNIKNFAKRMDTSEIGGAMVLGLPVPVVKSHGNSNSVAICSSIRQVRKMVSGQMIEKVVALLKQEETGETNE